MFKLMQQQADIDLFKAIGFTDSMVIIFGAVQLIGGLLLIPSKTRQLGAYIVMITFVIASIAVFANQLIVFGIVSLVFIVMAYLVIIMERNPSYKQ